MKLRCPYPRCTQTVSVADRTCPACGNSLALQPILRLYAGNLRNIVVGIKCPDCGSTAQLPDRVCPNLASHSSLTLASVANALMKAPREHWHRFLDNANETTAWRIQWVYLLASAALLWLALSCAEKQWSEHWFLYGVLAAFYFLAFGLLAPLVAPAVDYRRVWDCAASRVKLGLICNWLSLLLAMQLLIGVWCARAVMLASLIVMGALAIRLLSRRRSTNQSEEVDFDPSESQGRRATFG